MTKGRKDIGIIGVFIRVPAKVAAVTLINVNTAGLV
jgi:hypothetical protein